MSSTKQREELQAAIWKIANDVRGAVDGWDFKQFVLGTLFYRFISENFTNFIKGGDESVQYAQLPDEAINHEIKDDATKTKGYFIYPSQLFVNVAKNANTNSNLNTDLAAIFSAIESSANGYPSEAYIKGLFAEGVNFPICTLAPLPPSILSTNILILLIEKLLKEFKLPPSEKVISTLLFNPH